MTEKLLKEKKISKFIYNRYYKEDYRTGKITLPGYEQLPVNYVTFRYYVDLMKVEEIKNEISDILKEYVGSLLEKTPSFDDDWGLHKDKCYILHGGKNIAELIDEYQYQISIITLKLLEKEKLISHPYYKNKEGRLYMVAEQWAHMVYNQMLNPK